MDERMARGGHYAAELEAPEVYRDRRRRLMERIGSGTIVMWGAGDERGYGDVGTFRQDPSFFYLTGVELPHAVLVLRPGDGEEALFLPPRNEPLERWTGPKWGPGDETGAALGFAQVLSIEPWERVIDARRRPVPGFEGRLADWLGDAEATLWTVLPSVPVSSELPPALRFVSRLRERLPSFTVRDVSSQLTELRVVKAEGEIRLMRGAIAATIAGMRAAARVVRPGVGEGVVDGAVYAAFRAAGAESVSFPTIVGSGFNGTVLHYDQNVGTCREGEMVVVDIGARWGYYCGDLTRTFPVSGLFSDRQRALYDLVLEARNRAESAIRPGATLTDVRKVAYQTFQDSPLRDARGERLGQHFIHGLGHFLGLEAHDPGGEVRPLAPGMVVTNEPGLYLQDEGIGIRIEDDHLVTVDGNENLSAALPRRADEILELMAESAQG